MWADSSGARCHNDASEGRWGTLPPPPHRSTKPEPGSKLSVRKGSQSEVSLSDRQPFALDPGPWTLSPGPWIPDPGCRTLTPPGSGPPPIPGLWFRFNWLRNAVQEAEDQLESRNWLSCLSALDQNQEEGNLKCGWFPWKLKFPGSKEF